MNRKLLNQTILGSLFLLVICCFMNQAFAAGIIEEQVPLQRAGVQLHLARYLVPDGKEKEPLLLVHGLTYSSHEFDVQYKDYSLARYLAQKGFEVWLLDIAGYGESERVANGFLPDSDYAAEDIASAVQLILKRHQCSAMDILGWSWGTVTSGRFAAKHPEMVKKLVLYAPIVNGLGESKVEQPFNENTWEHAASDFQMTADHQIDRTFVEPAVVNTYLANCWRYDKNSSPNGGRRDLMTSPEKRLIPTADIQAPVLIIAGSKDPYVSPVQCREAYQTLPNHASQLVLIKGASHVMLMEKPYYKAFREQVVAFLRK